MAQRRMFSLKVVDTDAFMDMPLSAQALYFHLGMRADDDGFVSNARRVQKLVGVADDDLKILLLKRFVMTFESGVIVIKHWRLNNYVKGDRYTPTLYQEEKNTLFVKGNGVYTDHPPIIEETGGFSPALPPEIPENVPDISWNQNGSKMVPQVRVGEVSKGKVSLGEVSIDSSNTYSSGGDGLGAEAVRMVEDFLSDRGTRLGSYLGVTEQVLKQAEEFTKAVFGIWANRAPNKNDIANVFLTINQQAEDPQTGQWSVTFPKDKQDLLMYAFEQASNAGHPGEWNYINGILKNLSMRNITTLGQAEQCDLDRS